MGCSHAQLVPAVTELMVAELLYLEKQGATLPIEMLINSSGTTRQDGEIVSLVIAELGLPAGQLAAGCAPTGAPLCAALAALR